MTTLDIDHAVSVLRSGGLVAFPTETVYGLGADAHDEAAVRRIFSVKRRPVGRALTVLLGTGASPNQWAQWSDVAERLGKQFWPGPLTLVLPRRRSVLDIVSGGQETVGLRIPDHRVALHLLERFGGGIAAPSANRSGGPSPTTAAHVRSDLGDEVDLILDGGTCPGGVESTVVSLVGAPRVLRLGAIPRSALVPLLGELAVPGRQEERRVHLRASIEIVSTERLSAAIEARDGATVVIGRTRPVVSCVRWIEAPTEPVAFGHALFGWLREVEESVVEHAIFEELPPTEEWEAITDRLRAASLRLDSTQPSTIS